MKLVHIIDSLSRGGAETLLVNTVAEFYERDPEIKQWVVTLYDGGELTNEINGKATCFSLNLTRTNFLGCILKFRKFLKEQKITVVHSHLLHATFIARLSVLANVGLVSTYHSVFYEPTMVTYAAKERIIDKLTYKERYFSVFVSDAVKQNIVKAIGIIKNYKVLMNFASSKFFYNYRFNPEGPLKIVMVGNLHEIKNHEIAIKAMAKFKELPIVLDIYGDGPLRSNLESLINKTNVKVYLKGKTVMSSEILGAYSLFAMTSHHEGMPLSLLEAMQTGLPSLLNDISMLKETAENAALYYNYDSQDSLEEKIEEIFNNRMSLIKLSEAAQKRALSFSANNYINELVNIYSVIKK